MKTKKELLEKYKGNNDLYETIKNHYGQNVAFQGYEGENLNFNRDSMLDLVGAKNLSYEDYIDIQIQTSNNYRAAFMVCYYNALAFNFKGEVEKFAKNKICFSRIYIEGMYFDGQCFEKREEHVWMDIEGFSDLKIGDCVSFSADIYRYIKTSNGKQIDYALINPKNIIIIEKYDLPTDRDLMIQSINSIICESCFLFDNCDRSYCKRNSKELNSLRKNMLNILEN